jgi:hypothetical protein
VEDKITRIMSPGEGLNSPNSELLGKGVVRDSNLFENNRNLIIDKEKIVALNQSDEIFKIEAKSEINGMMHTEDDIIAEKFQDDSDVKINPKDVRSFPLHAPPTIGSTISINSDIPINIPIIEFVTNMVNNVVDIGIDSHIDLIENNAANSSHIDSLKVDNIDNFDNINNEHEKKLYEIDEVSGNVDIDCVQLIIDEDSETNETLRNDSQQLLKNNLEFQILNGMKLNLSSSIIIPQNTDLNDLDVSGGNVCIIPTDNSKCAEIESINSNSSDIESKRRDDSEITITNRSSSAGVNNDHPTRLDKSVPSITSSPSMNNDNLTIPKLEESSFHSHTLIIDPLHVHTDSLVDTGSSTTDVLEANPILDSSLVDANSGKETIINCLEKSTNLNASPLSEVPCIEDLKPFVEVAVIKDADPFINNPLNTSSSDSQTSLVSLISSPRNIDPTHMNIEVNSEKSTADNVAESEAEAQDELDMHKETEKMDRESKIARRAFEQRIQKHKLIQVFLYIYLYMCMCVYVYVNSRLS